jgi:hypothetical protein
MQQCQISLKIDTTNSAVPLGVEIWLDNTLLLASPHITHSTPVVHNLDDAEGTHELRMVLKNKQPEHTQIDSNGHIVSDARIMISQVMFDQIDLSQILVDNAVYQHNFNGHSDPVQESFYGEMGCNGTVSLQFNTPVYVWLLEKM